MKTWKKFAICSISTICLLFAAIIIDLACAGEDDPYDYYISFFHNKLQGERNYGAFYLSYHYTFSDQEPESEADINSSEWAAYLGNGVKAADVKHVMYEASAKDDSAMLANNLIAEGKLPDSLKANTFLKSITSGTNDRARNYYLFAKTVEKDANVAFSDWDPRPVDTPSLGKYAGIALKQANTETDKFLKLRYLYQAQRLYHYSGDPKTAMEIYDKSISGYPSTSHIKGYALSLKAGEERKLGKPIEAAYLFSKIFSQYPERRVQAYRDYNYCSVAADEVAGLAKTNNEKAAIYAIDGFSDYGANLKSLQKTYAYAPSSEMVGVLLTREVNKLEDAYLSPKLNNQLNPDPHVHKPDTGDLKQLAILHQLESFSIKLSADGKYPEKSLGYTAAAYLAWMAGNNSQGLEWMVKATQLKSTQKMRDQQLLVSLLLDAQTIQQNGFVNEDKLVPQLKWLDARVAQELKQPKPSGEQFYYGDSDYDDKKFAASSRDFYNLVLAPAYLLKHDTIKSALCMLKSEYTFSKTNYGAYDVNYTYGASNALPDFWKHELSAKQVEQLIVLKKNPGSNAYISYLSHAALSNARNNDLYDLLGTTYLREHNYTAAVKALEQVKTKGGKDANGNYVDTSEIANPFISQLPDYPKIFLNADSQGYSKLKFARVMAALMQKLKTDPSHAATHYFTIATGLYNASTHGNAYYLISYDWSSYDYGRASKYSYDRDYIKSITAEQYFLKARAAGNSAEFKARCTFMAAKCREKQYVAPDYFENDKKYDYKVRHNPYFAVLKNTYGNTAFYKEAVEDCSYLRDFLAEGKRKK